MKESLHKTLVGTSLAAAAGLNAAAQDAMAAGSRPNIVFIMADDMGYGDPTCYGGTIATPNLDRMAREGLKFIDFHSTGSVCSPSRAGLLTGRYQQRAGIDGVITADPSCSAYKLGLDVKTPTFAGVMTKNGYTAALFGKWHLGYLPEFHPMNFRFDRFVGYVSGNVDYLSHYDRMGTFDWWHDRKLTKEKGYTTHLITRHAVEYIRQHKDEPFCVYVAHEAVHSPMQGPNEAIQRGPDRVKGRRRPNDEVFKDMLQEMDKGIGQVLAAIRDAGIAEKTLVIFTSDNGPMKFSSPGPLRGRKGSIYEGGHRVPTIAWWPGTIKPNTVTAETGIGIDIFPTMLDLAGIETDLDLDGVSLKPVLFGGELEPRKLFWRNSGLSPSAKTLDCKDSPKAIRDGNWKLVASAYYKKLELFDLETDVGEKTDLAAKYPERVAEMKADLVKWESEMIPSLPYRILPQKTFR